MLLRTIRTRVPGIVIVPVLAFLSLAAWSLASPVGASPDDDFHLASIWCGVGERAGICEAGDQADERDVAADLVIDSVCYAYHPTVSASCQGDDFGDHPDQVVSSGRGNFAGLYPPVFYFVDGLLASPDINASVIAMRLLNAALFVLLGVATYLLLPIRLRPALLTGLVLPMVPLGMFIIPSTNPSSWALLSAGVLWISVLGYYESTGRRRVGLAAVAAIATVLGGGARADAAVYAVIAIGIAGFLAFRRDRAFLLQSITPLALVIVSVLFYFSASQSGSALGGLEGAQHRPASISAWIALFVLNLANAPDLWVGVFGKWGLGWLDTAMPAAVWVGAFGILVGAIAIALRSRTRRVNAAIVGLVALLFVVPSYILTQTNAVVGGYVQPRYIMPLIVILAGVALVSTGRRFLVPRSALIVAVPVLALANSLALYVNIRRYVTGIDSMGPNLDSGAEWWWSGVPGPMVVWIGGSIAFAALLVVLTVPLGKRGSDEEPLILTQPALSGSPQRTAEPRPSTAGPRSAR